ncbi:MAG: NlpC/P60 family protein [Thermoleophilia bacterium]|jgi:cell wall-associated NlpC family hydrolase
MKLKLKNKANYLVWAATCLMSLLVVMCLAVPVFAQTADSYPQGDAGAQVDSLQSQANALRAELDVFNHDLEGIVEKHNATRTELEQLTIELADSRQRLDEMTSQHSAQKKILTDRLTAVYKTGDINVVSILLSSNSLSDFFEQSRYIAKISEQDAKLERQFKSSAENIRDLTDGIDQKRSRQMSLEKELGEQRIQIEANIEVRKTRLDQVDSQVKQIIDQEIANQRAEQARNAAEAAALLQQLGISDEVQAQVVQTSFQYLGVPYVWGGESPSGLDCSGLTKYVFAQHGVRLPHNAAMQFNLGVPVPREQLQPGDLVFWGPGAPHHVAMYIGQGKYIEAPNFGEVVKISTLSFDGDYAGARRYPLMARGSAAR